MTAITVKDTSTIDDIRGRSIYIRLAIRDETSEEHFGDIVVVQMFMCNIVISCFM